jgi:antitoxin VapB
MPVWLFAGIYLRLLAPPAIEGRSVNNLSKRKSEVSTKLARLRERMAARQVDAVLLNTIANTAWITAGASTYVNQATDMAASSVLITTDHAYVLTDGIEGPRLRQEEKLADLGFELILEPWYARGKAQEPLLTGKRLGQDGPGSGTDVGTDLQHLRTVLQPEEVARMRHVCVLAAEAMDDAVRSVRPGNPEYDLAARLSAACNARGGSAIVNLIASDDRIYQYRHPLPTSKTVERYAMLVLCMRYEGLIAAITRLVHFGPLPADLRDRAMAVTRVDGRMILGTRTGRTLGDMFEIARQAYKDEGYPQAIEEHHQGGSMSYQPREVLAHPGDKTPVELNQVFAWNPSVSGSKSEDTILLGANGPEVLTTVANWPTWKVTVDGQNIERPAILEA